MGSALGVASLGVNSAVSNGQAWLAEDGPYKANMQNNAGEDIVLVCWGVAGSWINVVQPTITASIAAGSSLTVSFADGASGACRLFTATRSSSMAKPRTHGWSSPLATTVSSM